MRAEVEVHARKPIANPGEGQGREGSCSLWSKRIVPSIGRELEEGQGWLLPGERLMTVSSV